MRTIPEFCDVSTESSTLEMNSAAHGAPSSPTVSSSVCTLSGDSPTSPSSATTTMSAGSRESTV